MKIEAPLTLGYNGSNTSYNLEVIGGLDGC